MQYYNGEFLNYYPDPDAVKDIVSKMRDYEAATVDIAVTPDDKTVVIEAHEFFSCGLYGFSDYNSLPLMLHRGYRSIKKKLETDNYKIIHDDTRIVPQIY